MILLIKRFSANANLPYSQSQWECLIFEFLTSYALVLGRMWGNLLSTPISLAKCVEKACRDAVAIQDSIMRVLQTPTLAGPKKSGKPNLLS